MAFVCFQYMSRPINVSCRLLTLNYFPLHLFFGIRDTISVTLFSLTPPVIRYPCMIACRVELRYSNLTIESIQAIRTVCLMTSCLPNRHEIPDLATLQHYSDIEPRRITPL